MTKKTTCFLFLVLLLTTMTLGGCKAKEKEVKIGVSIAVMNAERWQKDISYMEARAKELGVTLEVIMSNADPAQQYEESKSLIDKGIDVLILTPSNAKEAGEIVQLAHDNGVKVISYDRIVLYEPIDLVVTFDGYKVGELQGKYLIETADTGNYVIFSGDENDYNSGIFLEGALNYINAHKDEININIVAQESIPKWSPDEAKAKLSRILLENNNTLAAVLAPNDKTAGGCIEALHTVGLAGKVPVTGMDADLSAAKRILAGTQDMTVFKDIRELSKTAVDQAVKLARGEKTDENSVLDTQGKTPAITLFVEPKLVTINNLDKVLIESGYFTHQEVYGS